MKNFSLRRSNGADVSFKGEKLSSVDSRDMTFRGNEKDRWTEMSLYRTEGGSFVVSTIGRSKKVGEVDLLRVQTFSSKEEMFDVIGFSRLAKSMYEESGLHIVEVIK